MTVNRANTYFYSGDMIDKVIGVFTDTIIVGAPTSGQGSLSTISNKAHGFRDSTYFKGIFTTDGGTTWNDFGAQTPYLVGAFPTFDTADCNATVSSTDVSITATSWYDYGNSRSQSYTFTYKILLIAKNTMAYPITPLITEESISLTSQYNCQKIAFQGEPTLFVADNTTGNISISHDLGYEPKVRAWWFDAATPSICRPLISARIQTKVNTSNVTFYVDNTFGVGSDTNGVIEYRIYYDD